MRRGRVACVADYANPVFVVGWQRVFAEVEDCPLQDCVSYVYFRGRMGRSASYHVQFLTCEVQQAAQRFAEIAEIVHQLFFGR